MTTDVEPKCKGRRAEWHERNCCHQKRSAFCLSPFAVCREPVGWGEQSDPQHIAKLNPRLSHAATLVLGFVPHSNIHESIQSVSRR